MANASQLAAVSLLLFAQGSRKVNALERQVKIAAVTVLAPFTARLLTYLLLGSNIKTKIIIIIIYLIDLFYFLFQFFNFTFLELFRLFILIH